MKPRYEVPYEEISSQSSLDLFYPNELIEDDIKNPYTLRNKPRRYLLKGILEEFRSSYFDDLFEQFPEDPEELFINDCLSEFLDGKPIPSHGFVLNMGCKVSEYGIEDVRVQKKSPQTVIPVCYSPDFSFPDDDVRESCLRTIVGMDEKHTIFTQIPFRLLTSKVEGQQHKPIRENHWVYRIRFIMKDETKYKDSLKQYYKGYIGATSREKVCYRFFQHFFAYKSNDKTNEVYRAWRDLRDHEVGHIIIFEVLERCSSRAEAFSLEADLIKSEGTLMPDGLNMTQGGEQGIRQCKACGIEADLESKDDFFADYVKSNRKKHITPVRSHLRRIQSGSITTVRGHWRCYTDVGRDILLGIMGISETEFEFKK